MKIRTKKTNLILMILLAIITILLASFLINLTARNDEIVSKKIATTIGKLEEEKIKMNVKIKEKPGNGIVYVLVKIESKEEIESITFPNEDETTITLTPQSERKTIAKDLKVELKKEYNVTINTKDGESVIKTIFLEADGTKEHPFIIRTKEELQAVNEDLSAYYILGANIDLTDFIYTPIGTEAEPFTGNIDGTGYTISNLKLDSEESDNIGLFGYNNGTITNITLNDITVKGKSNVGGLVGYNTGTITNCIVSGSVTGTGDNVGGLIGYVYASNKNITLSENKAEGKVIGINQVGGLIGNASTYTSNAGTYRLYIQKSYATGDVEGASNVGGLVGYQYAHGVAGTINISSQILIQECYATGNVTSRGNQAGGLVGYLYACGNGGEWTGGSIQGYNIIQNSFATGDVKGASNVGGLVGYIYRLDQGYKAGNAYNAITNAYAIGEVVATGASAKVGGLIGASASSGKGSTTATNSYWTPETTKQENSALGIKNIIPFMLRKLGYEAWDFETIWEIEEGQTIAYLKNVQKPASVNKENITYEEFDVVGEGTESSPFIITTPVQLQKISEKLASYYKLGANIDLTGRTWTPIGTSSAPFIGTIDGTGYTISNLNYDNESGENVGLFGYNTGTISNITLESITVKGKTNVGGLVGYNTGSVTNCVVKGNITGIGDNIGILIGYNSGTITDNIAEGTVTGTGNNTGGLIGQTITGISGNTSKAEVYGQANTGGLIGYVYASNKNITLSENKAEGKVIGINQVGGLIGNASTYTSNAGTYRLYIQKSYATGDVEGASNVGGLVGYQYAHGVAGTINISSQILIQECYATGNVTATGNQAGGLVGYLYAHGNGGNWTGGSIQGYNIIQNSFATGDVEGTSNVGGLVGYIYRLDQGYKAGNAYNAITNTYAIGEVVATGTSAKVGGLIGASAASGSGNTTVTDSFWNTETTKQETSVLGTASNIEGMTGTELYTNWSADIWTIELGKYPKLKF